jgi:cell division protein FtsZ
MPKINPSIETYARIKVVGVGGSGKGALNHMIEHGTEGVDFIAVNADVQDLHHSLAEKKIHIGKNFTKGLGAGMDPEKGRRAAEETKEELQEAIHGADMVFIACGMGGGTGTGAAPVVAKISREEGILTIGVVTKPFYFEGRERMRIAEEGLAELEKEVDALIVIPNDRIIAVADPKMPVGDGFAMCNEVLRQAVEGISDLIVKPGTFGNIDFADIRTILSNSGTALMGVGIAGGERRAQEAAQKAINSPLLDISINGAKGILFSITGGPDMTMHEMQEAAKIIYEVADKDAKIITGTTIDPEMRTGELKVTVIATGFPNANRYSPGFSSREGFGVIKNIQHSNTTTSFPTTTKTTQANSQNSSQTSSNTSASTESSFRSLFGNKTTTTPIIEKKPVIIDENESSDNDDELVSEKNDEVKGGSRQVQKSNISREENLPRSKDSVSSGQNPENQKPTTSNQSRQIVANISDDDSDDDWSSAIPSILRRNR